MTISAGPTTMPVRWGAKIVGRPEDVVELERLLREAALDEQAPSIVWLDGTAVLCSREWDSLTDPGLIWDQAREMLQLLVGCVDLVGACNPLSVDCLYRKDDDGSWATIMILQDSIRLRSVLHTDAARFQSVLDMTKKHDWFGTCLTLLDERFSWFNAYIIIEEMKRYLGGTESGMVSALANGSEMLRVKRTANTFRHLKGGRHTAPVDAPSLDDARQTLRVALEQLLLTLP